MNDNELHSLIPRPISGLVSCISYFILTLLWSRNGANFVLYVCVLSRFVCLHIARSTNVLWIKKMCKHLMEKVLKL
jgi:hypothetical protein